jgi:hypothetical protein
MKYPHLFQLQLEIDAYTREEIDEAFSEWFLVMEKVEQIKFRDISFPYSEPIWDTPNKTCFWVRFLIEAEDIAEIQELGEIFPVIEEDYPLLVFEDSHIVQII